MKRYFWSIILTLFFFDSYSYAQTNNGLVGWWRFDEGTGTSTTADSSGQGNTGILENSPSWVTGKYGYALSFDGTDQYVDVPNASSINPSSAITVSAWFYLSSSAVGYYQPFVSKADGGLTVGWEMASSSNTLRTTLRPGTTTNVFGAAITPNTWEMGTFTYDGTTLKLYLNGVLCGSTTGSATINSTADLNIGRRASGPGYFTGLVDEVRVYNRALTAGEVYELFEGGGQAFMGAEM